MIRILLADDQMILAEGIKAVLLSCKEFEVCGIATDGAQAVEMSEKYRPDVVLMDIRMPNMNGVVATKRIKEIDENIKIVILTTFDDSDYILSAINNGASGYLLKDVGASALIDAVKNAYAGDTILPAKIAKKITDVAALLTSDREIKLRNAFGFSDREVEVALMIADGFTNRQIAAALKLADGTARNYISTVYLKLNADSRAEAIRKIKNV